MLPNFAAHRTVASICFLLAIATFPSPSVAQEAPSKQRIEIDLGDYRFKPSVIEVTAGKPVDLVLSNRDQITPHDFVLEAPQSGLSVKADVGAGETVVVTIRPTAPGEYTFYCSKKLLFFPSHRERGMEGTLKVTAAP